MFREILIAAAVAGTAMCAAPCASADEPHGPFAGDPPGNVGPQLCSARIPATASENREAEGPH